MSVGPSVEWVQFNEDLTRITADLAAALDKITKDNFGTYMLDLKNPVVHPRTIKDLDDWEIESIGRAMRYLKRCSRF